MFTYCTNQGCSYRSNQVSNVRSHEATVHSDEKPFRCRHKGCDFRTNRSNTLKSHQATHASREKSATCPLCLRGFYNLKDLKRHRDIHHGEAERVHKCHVCPQSFVYKSNLQRHINTHTGEKPYKCDNCEFSAADKSCLNRHQAQHVQTIKDLNCSFEGCNFKTRFQWNMRKHVRGQHTIVPTYKCELCPKAYKQHHSLVMHTAGKHNGEKQFKCSECPYYTLYDWCLAEHHYKIHQNRSIKKFRQFRCRLCNFRGFNKDIITHFARKHPEAEKIPFGCDQENCNYVSDSSNKLVSHLKVHEHTVTTACRICGKKFALARDLKIHLRQEHPGKLRFQCDQCELTFDYLSALQKHKQWHAKGKTITKNGGQLTLNCRLCQETVRAGPKFRRHMRIIHPGERAFKCCECNFTANYYSGIKKHAMSIKNHCTNGFSQPSTESATSMRDKVTNQVENPRLRPCSVILSRIALLYLH